MSIYLELEAELREVHTDEGVLLARHQAVDGAGLVQVPAALLNQAFSMIVKLRVIFV